jgi:hypothetical protein
MMMMVIIFIQQDDDEDSTGQLAYIITDVILAGSLGHAFLYVNLDVDLDYRRRRIVHDWMDAWPGGDSHNQIWQRSNLMAFILLILKSPS